MPKTPEGDYASPPSPEGQMSFDEITPPEFPPPPPENPRPWAEPPPSARRAVKIQVREDSDEFDRRDTNYPQTAAQIRQDIGGTLATPEDIEQEAAKRSRKMIQSSSRPKPRRPGFGRAADTADSDARVKFEYGGED